MSQIRKTMKKCWILLLAAVIMLFMQLANIFYITQSNSLRHALTIRPRYTYRTLSTNGNMLKGTSIPQPRKKHYTKGGPPVHNLPYLCENKRLCIDRNLTFIIFVFTAPGNFDRRENIRHTWGNKAILNNHQGLVVFLLGNMLRRDLQAKIKREIKLHDDIIQENFMESYENITFKDVMTLRWLTENCKNVKYIIKVDDDVFLNIFKVADFIAELNQKNINETSRSFYCCFHIDEQVVRNPEKRWYVSRTQYKQNIYPLYCNGMALLYTRDMVDELYAASWRVPFIPVEDAYTSGLLATYIGRVRYHESFYGGLRYWMLPKFYVDRDVPLKMSGPIEKKHYRKLWDVIMGRMRGIDHTKRLMNSRIARSRSSRYN